MNFLYNILLVSLLASNKFVVTICFSINGDFVKKSIRTNNHHRHFTFYLSLSSSNDSKQLKESAQPDDLTEMDSEGPMKLTSPLKFIGPYPCVSLHFPELATSSQREREVAGISLDFVLDTAANTNTINAQVAAELKLEDVGSSLPGYNAAGAMDGATTFMLGDCTLDLPEKELFMKDLTASALPVASPAAAGLLGTAFLNCFQGGVKFDWMDDASVTFFGDDVGLEAELDVMKKAPIKIIKDVLLPSIVLKINGKEIRALLDTGSPISVLNSSAAKLAGLNVIEILGDQKSESDENKGGFVNPFKKVFDSVKEANSLAQAAARGDVLLIGGIAGQPVQLLRTQDNANICIQGAAEDISFPQSKVYVGDLPGLAALGGLDGDASPPAAILGMDILRQKSSMFYRMNEVFFPED